jgi:chromosomal replication initiation ATPase DnaA
VLDARFRFENFVVGASNRLAASAARAVADAPGAVYNPLVVYSRSGLGKTHLLTAIGHAAQERHAGLDAQYVTTQALIDELTAAIAAGDPGMLATRYENVHLFLLDDIQFLSGQSEAQNALLRLFNALQQEGRQLVVASDRAPAEIPDVDQGILSRMAGGLAVDMGAPDYETRVAILRRKRADRGLSFPSGVLEQLANAPVESVRELEGALNLMVAHQIANGEAPGAEGSPPGSLERSDADEFDSFVSEVAVAVTRSVEIWKVRLGESIARWSGEGFSTAMLERALEGNVAPDLRALEATFAAAAAKLRTLEAEAVSLDSRLAGLDAFRNPENIADAEAVVLRAIVAYDPPPLPNPRWTIDDYVVGERNQLAVRAAGEVIALPGARYNPLFVYGNVRSGKTHLLHAVGNAIAAREGGGWAVACVSASAFTDELIDAIEEGSLDRWRKRYRAADALVVDDVQSLAGKERSQEELFHLFNGFLEAGKQIVLGANVHPTQLVNIDARLTSRFDAGLVVQIGQVTESERVARYTPVPVGAEAAAPTIDAWFDEVIEVTPPGDLGQSLASLGGVDSHFLDPEKCITEWPGIEGRVSEEAR